MNTQTSNKSRANQTRSKRKRTVKQRFTHYCSAKGGSIQYAPNSRD